MTTLVHDLDAATATAPPLIFTGEAGFVAAGLRETRTVSAADAIWADSLVADLGAGERALVSLSFTPEGPAIAHRVMARPADASVEVSIGTVETARIGRGVHRVTELPTSAAYAGRVRSALELIDAGLLSKVVLGRWLEIESSPALRAEELIGRLLASGAGRYTFALPLGSDAGSPVLLGASPELLVRRTGRSVASTPLAGSVPRTSDPAEDRAAAERLLCSAKDLAEHAFVVDQIVGALRSVSSEVSAPQRPELLATDTLWHLATPIRARLAPGVDLSALHLAQLLQPTPAVGGVPTAAALETIARLEGPRGPLTGAVGWVDGRGDGEFAVTIRAGVLDGERLRIYAGAGIVAASEPDAEVRETAAKLATMARVVGVGR
ncbi:MAG: isochorismate synthase [Nocardioides sp.]|uniref:isochorismate synthase n=1 Tax=Nocardioides sp. TaxID=35761 RepID=UPI0039E559EA